MVRKEKIICCIFKQVFGARQMIRVSSSFKNACLKPDRQLSLSVLIEGVTFGPVDIVELSIKDSIQSGSTFTLGTAISSELTLSLRTTEEIPVNAKVELKLKAADECIPYGVYYIDKRKQSGNYWQYTCYDALLLAEQPYISQLTYPASVDLVLAEACELADIALNAAADPTQKFEIAPTGYSCRSVIGLVASGSASCARMDKGGKLVFVPFAPPAAVETITLGQYSKLIHTNPSKTLSRVVCLVDDESSALVAGAGDAGSTLSIDNPYLNQAAVDTVQEALNGFTYYPFSMDWSVLPWIEVGDQINIEEHVAGDRTQLQTFSTTVLSSSIKYSGGFSGTIAAGSDSQQQSEFKPVGTIGQQISRLNSNAVKLGKPYYGVTVTKEEGLQVEKSDGSSRVVLNSDELTFYRGSDKALYFDPVTGEYIFDGKLSADMITALEAEFDVTVSNVTITNVLAAETGYIAELTVDQLETSDKVQRYLAEDTSDLNYLRAKDQYIEWVTAVKTGSDTQQARDRNNNPLYWKDADKKAVILDSTPYPVLTYTYVEAVKRKIGFESVDGVYVPVDIYGEGTGADNRGKGIVRKAVDGLELEYITENGQSRMIKLGEDGIIMTPYDLEQLAFFNNGFIAQYSGETVARTWTKDSSGRIIKLTDPNTGATVPVSWNNYDM